MKKLLGILLIALVLGAAIYIYLNNGGRPRSIEYSTSMNFHKEDFEEQYSHYEKKLSVSEGNTEIFVMGKTKSGKIDIQIIDNVTGETHKYSISGIVNEKIALSGEHSLEWTAIVDCYEDTEGSFEILVK